MELPRALRQAVDEALEKVPLAELRRAAERLSARYRSETRDGKAHLSDDLAALAYLGVRLPATYAAVSACLIELAQVRRDFAPRTMLDVGAGPGTAVFAAQELWVNLEEATLVEGSGPIRRRGEQLLAQASPARVSWHTFDMTGRDWPAGRFDLVTLAYVLDELPPAQVASLTERLWQSTGDVLLLVEPGTPAGCRRILAAREKLIALGAHIVAPCPHAHACPLAEADWCHFARRVARSRMHRQIKSADVPWEDEKYIYLVASRHPGAAVAARVLTPPMVRGGTVSLKLCEATGKAAQRLLSRRNGEQFRQARRLAWGDAIFGGATIPADSDG